MGTVKWVVDKYLFDEYECKLSSLINESGSSVVFHDDLKSENFETFMKNNFTSEDIIVFHGSLQHGRWLSKQPYYPGVFMTMENYECLNYYGYFGDNLLNSDYVMLGLNDVLRNKNKICDTLSITGNKLFIRPSDGFKSFSGNLLSLDNFESELRILINSYGGVKSNTLVLFSSPKVITEEYRFIVVDKEVISGSLYLDIFNKDSLKPYYDRVCENQDAINFAKEMSKIYQPDVAYTIDVCKTGDGKYKLLEINSFNCASFYGNCNKDVIESVNNLAIKEYNDLFSL